MKVENTFLEYRPTDTKEARASTQSDGEGEDLSWVRRVKEAGPYPNLKMRQT